MNNFSELIPPIELSSDKLAKFGLLPNPLAEIPEKKGSCNAEKISETVEIEKSEINRRVAIRLSPWCNELAGGDFVTSQVVLSTVTDLKEVTIRDAIEKLAKQINAHFKSQIEKAALPFDRFIQIVETPFTVYDLYPGGTKIKFKVVTKRELQLLENSNN